MQEKNMLEKAKQGPINNRKEQIWKQLEKEGVKQKCSHNTNKKETNKT